MTWRPDWPLAAGLIGGAIVDAVAGDPQRGHPVALFGRVMSALEHRVYADRVAVGACFTVAGVVAGVVPPLVLARLGGRGAASRSAVTAATTWAVVASRSLSVAAAQVARALEADDLPRARSLLPALCGRDPHALDRDGLARAVVESVAENSSDAVVAPLFWGGLAGPAGLSGYRAVNTLDAMVGHHSVRYERFGKASARLDDIANWTPARVTALLAAGCAPLVGGSPAAAWQTARRDGPAHPSPNAGWCEAAFAGALGLRLGGTLSYAGRIEHRPELGTGRPPAVTDIARAIRLSRAVAASATVVAAGLAVG